MRLKIIDEVYKSRFNHSLQHVHNDIHRVRENNEKT